MSTVAPFILLHPDDNVLVCRAATGVGEIITIDTHDIALETAIAVGHKIARRPIGRGQKIIKYGAPIGSMTADVSLGDHVHMHNMKSDYIQSHSREATGHE